MTKLTCKLPDGLSRIETGPLQINDDWPGTFIRGDDSAYYAHVLEYIIPILEKNNCCPLTIIGPVKSLRGNLGCCIIK